MFYRFASRYKYVVSSGSATRDNRTLFVNPYWEVLNMGALETALATSDVGELCRQRTRTTGVRKKRFRADGIGGQQQPTTGIMNSGYTKMSLAAAAGSSSSVVYSGSQ